MTIKMLSEGPMAGRMLLPPAACTWKGILRSRSRSPEHCSSTRLIRYPVVCTQKQHHSKDRYQYEKSLTVPGRINRRMADELNELAAQARREKESIRPLHSTNSYASGWRQFQVRHRFQLCLGNPRPCSSLKAMLTAGPSAGMVYATRLSGC